MRIIQIFIAMILFEGSAFGQLSTHFSKQPRISLVLSGGGARGLAHIGVLEVLDSAHIPIDLIIGTSMGAVVGGLYAAGYSTAELEEIALKTNWQDILSIDDDSHRSERSPEQKDATTPLLSLRFNGFFHPVLPVAISSGQRLTMFLNSLILRSPYGTRENFLHDLRVPFISLATDIVSGQRVLLTHGDLTTALRASATLPLRFYPLVHDSTILVDGGLLSNIPIDIARDSAKSVYVIASNTTAELRSRDELRTPWDVADQVISLMMRKENVEQLKSANVIITPDLGGALADNFQNADQYIEAGKVAARAMLPKLHQLIEGLSAVPKITDQEVKLLPVIQDIRIHGVRGADADSLQQMVIPMRGNALGNRSLETMFLEPITAFLHRKGYSLARIDSSVIITSVGRLDVFVDPGYVSEIKIRGLYTIQPVVVLDQLPFGVGEVLHSNECDRALKNLTATGFFSYANMAFSSLSPTEPILRVITDSTGLSIDAIQQPHGSAIVIMTVEERAAQVLRLGGLADNEFGAQFSMEYANENLFGLGAELSLKGGLGNLSRYAMVRFSGGPPLVSISVATYSNYKDIASYSFHEDIPNGKFTSTVDDVVRELCDFGAGGRVGINIGRDASLSGEYRMERQRNYSLRSGEDISNPELVASIKTQFTYDSRDDPDYPHAGEYVEATYETGPKILGSDVGYTKLAARIDEAIPLSRLHTVQLQAEIGVADRTTPRQDEFTLGGITSFFGLNEYELRGNQFVHTSLGYQIAIPNSLFFPTFVLIRYDLGARWLEPTAIKFESLIHGMGLQIGFKTPIGLARFGLGENFRFAQSTKKPLLWNTPRFYFSIGSNL